MNEVLTLALPFFGLIFIGYACGLIKKIPDEGLAWLNFYIIYVSLPALFFKIIGRTPLSELARFDFILTSLAATYTIFAIVFLIGRFGTRVSVGEATLQGLATLHPEASLLRGAMRAPQLVTPLRPGAARGPRPWLRAP